MDKLCLFRFEDYFEPTGKFDRSNINECILRHIRRDESYFYSYGTHLIPCMAKYYHYPKANEKISLSYAINVPSTKGFNVGGFSSYEEARCYFNNPLFPTEYPSIEDGEVLMTRRITASSMKFGYAAYFLVMLTALSCNSGMDMEVCLGNAARRMSFFKEQLMMFNVQKITKHDVDTARKILSLYYTYDNYRCTMGDVLNMPIWATTFPMELERNKFLAQMLYT